MQVAFIDIRTQHRDMQMFAFIDEESDLLDLCQVAAEHRSHEFRRVVRLQVGHPVRNNRIAGRMGFIESITGKSFPVRPDLIGYFLIITILFYACNKIGLQLVDHILFLFPHPFARAHRHCLW